jgi:hypothetical protein
MGKNLDPLQIEFGKFILSLQINLQNEPNLCDSKICLYY